MSKLSKVIPFLIPLGLLAFAGKIYLDGQERAKQLGETEQYLEGTKRAEKVIRDDRELTFFAEDVIAQREAERFPLDINQIRAERDKLRGPVDLMTQQTLQELANFDLDREGQWGLVRQRFQSYGQEYQQKSKDTAEIKQRFVDWHPKFVEAIAQSGPSDKEDLVPEIRQLLEAGSTDPYLRYCCHECEYTLLRGLKHHDYDLVDAIEDSGYSAMLRVQILRRLIGIYRYHQGLSPNQNSVAGLRHQPFILVLLTEAIRDAMVECADEPADRVWPVMQQAMTLLPMQNVKFVFGHSIEALPQDTYLLYLVGGFLSAYRGLEADDWEERQRQLLRAAKYYHAAWLVDPQQAAAPNKLIRFGDLRGENDWNARDWLNVSLSIDGSDTQAYWDYYEALKEGFWSDRGSMESPLDFARECLKTDQFAAGVPAFYFEILFTQYQRGNYLFDGVEMERDLADSVNRLEQWLQTDAGQSANLDSLSKLRAFQLVLLLRYNNWADARRLCRMLPGNNLLVNPEQMLTDYEASRRILEAVTHDAGEPLVYVEEMFGKNVLGDNSASSVQLAIDRVEAFGARDDLSDSQRQYVTYRMSVLQAEQDYLSGKETPLPIAVNNPLWSIEHVGHVATDGNREEFKLAEPGVNAELISMVALDPPFVLRTVLRVNEALPDVQVSAENGGFPVNLTLLDSFRTPTPVPGPLPMGQRMLRLNSLLPVSGSDQSIEILVTEDTYTVKADGEELSELEMGEIKRVNFRISSQFDLQFEPITVQRLETPDEE